MKLKRNKIKSDEERLPKEGSPGKSKRDSNNSVIQWEDKIEPVRRPFPGHQKVSVPMRIAIDRGAFVDVTAHVLESIDEEVCGVLVGEVCEDDEGTFVHVRNIIRGTSTRQGNTHVTFTHETWNHIHQQLEKEFPVFHIVGWYHSHPGFGVLFSEMDLFIQKNFFPSLTQFALVMDPVGGERALCINTPGGIQYVDRFWVDSRELRTSYMQQHEMLSRQDGIRDESTNSHIEERIGMVDIRLSKILQVLEKKESSISRPLIAVLAFLLLVVLIFTFRTFLKINYTDKNTNPPEFSQYVPVAVKVGDKEAFLGIGIIKWNIPLELSTQILEYIDKKPLVILENDKVTQEELRNLFQSIIDTMKKCFKPVIEMMKLFLKTGSSGTGDIKTKNDQGFQTQK